MQRHSMRHALAGLGAAVLLLWSGGGQADQLERPEGRVILTVSGGIAVSNTADDAAEFDRTMIEALPSVTVTTTTPWTEGVVTFEGVSGADLMQAVGGQGEIVSAVALNDYAVDIPFDEFAGGWLFVAYRQDGRPISVRERGPLWILYPFDDEPEYDDQIYYARSVWQLRSLEVR